MNVDWKDVLARDTTIGGQIFFRRGGETYYRGSVAKAWIDDNEVHFEFEWLAKETKNVIGQFEACENMPLILPLSTQQRDNGSGRIQFDLPTKDWGILFPKGDSSIAPHRVQGLVCN